MFDLKREFEEQQNRSSGVITYEYGLDPVNDFLLDGEIRDFDEGIRKLDVLNTVDTACMAFESALLSDSETISYETALENFSNVISQNGFTLQDFGFASEGLSKESAILTVESADDVSMWKKVWNWIKQKIAAIWAWIKEKWDLITGKTAKLNKVLDELEKQVENIPEGGFSKESGLTHEGASKNKLYFKDIASIPGAPMLADYGTFMVEMDSSKYIQALDHISYPIGKYMVELERGKIETPYSKTVKNVINEYLSVKLEDPNIKFTNFIKADNECIPTISGLTRDTVTFSFITVLNKEATNFKDALDFSKKRVANITKNISPDKELKLLSKSEILKYIKELKSAVSSVNEMTSGLKKGLEKNGFIRIGGEKSIKNAPIEEKSNVIDLYNYITKLTQWTLSLTSQMSLGLESCLRVLSVHTKKHYVNQH